MHDIAHHIENLLTELPAHIEEEECKKKVLEAVGLIIRMKEMKRAVDFQCSLITPSSYLKGTASTGVQNLLHSLVDMQDVLYWGDAR